jgi:hypothetical protein
MTKADLLAAITGRPQPFDLNGVTFHLLPIPWGELKALRERHEQGSAETGEALTYDAIARSVCDPAGTKLFVPADCELLPLSTINALFAEIARRSGAGDRDTGKAPPPTTS